MANYNTFIVVDCNSRHTRENCIDKGGRKKYRCKRFSKFVELEQRRTVYDY